MARPMYASFLPTITCSNCGAEIEISAMGDHLCTGNPEDALPQFGRTDHDRIPASHLVPPEPSATFLYPPGKQEPFLPVPRFSAPVDPVGRSQSSASLSLTTTVSAERIPTSRMPQDGHRALPSRSATDPIPLSARPPSDDVVISQDSPFPTFPTRKSMARSNAPNRLALKSDGSSSSGSSSPYGPLSPALSSGANLLKRMDSIAPGPFNSRSRANGDRNGPRSPLGPAPGAIGVSEPQPANGPPPASQPLQRPPRPETDDFLNEKLQTSIVPSFQTLPQATEPETKAESTAGTIPPLPRFSQSTRGHSLTESESSATSQSVSDSRTASSRSSHSPLTSNAPSEVHRKLSIDQSYYPEPTREHTSLNAVLEDSPSPASEIDRNSETMVANRFGENSDLSLSPTAQESQRSPSLAAEQRISDMSVALSRAASVQSIQTPPDNGLRLSSLRYDPKVRNGRASGPLPPTIPSVSVEAPSRPAERRPTTRKAKCRGCELPIVGKSIKAADGRLTGRWHRECLTCHTCKAPFQTADFYVLDDQPYCAQHYHELNHSLCQQCNTGIEGKYLETQPSQRYHVECFTCHDCSKPLTRDYFEMNQRFYCEADAFRGWQKSKMLTPGRRFPERRTTKLIFPTAPGVAS